MLLEMTLRPLVDGGDFCGERVFGEGGGGGTHCFYIQEGCQTVLKNYLFKSVIA